MKRATTSPLALAGTTEVTAAVDEARDAVGASFGHFCLKASLAQMPEEDAMALAVAPHAGASDRPGYRRGRTGGPVGFHGGKVTVARPRVRTRATGKEFPLPWLQRGCTGRLAGTGGDEPDADGRCR